MLDLNQQLLFVLAKLDMSGVGLDSFEVRTLNWVRVRLKNELYMGIRARASA